MNIKTKTQAGKSARVGWLSKLAKVDRTKGVMAAIQYLNRR